MKEAFRNIIIIVVPECSEHPSSVVGISRILSMQRKLWEGCLIIESSALWTSWAHQRLDLNVFLDLLLILTQWEFHFRQNSSFFHIWELWENIFSIEKISLNMNIMRTGDKHRASHWDASASSLVNENVYLPKSEWERNHPQTWLIMAY